MPKHLASIIIVNWNGKRFLRDCLRSLYSQSVTDFEIILVDNGSTDDSQSFVRNKFPAVNLIPLSKNIGFSPANNIGISHSKAKYIITLNNDTTAAMDWLENLLVVAERETVAMVASKMIYDVGDRTLIDSVGLRVCKNGLGINVGNGETDRGQYDNLTEVFAPCAGAALYRRKMLEEIGMFDTDYFAYYEDLDLGWRARLAGKRCKPAPDAVVYHHHSGSSSGKKDYFLHRNKIFTLIKNLPKKLFLKYFPEIVSTDIMASAYSIISGNEFLTLQAKIDALKLLPKMWHKRKRIQAHKKISDKELERWFRDGKSLMDILKRRARVNGIRHKQIS